MPGARDAWLPWMPDPVIRFGIRRLLVHRLRAETQSTEEAQQERAEAQLAAWRSAPLAVHTADANAQHYEVPTAFFQNVLGRHLKYSSGYWLPDDDTLDAAEARMLTLTCERAQLAEGQEILELGCGWGSLTLFMAERYPGSRITAVSNSRTQRAFIESQVQARGLRNVEIVTADMNEFDPGKTFDRVVSVEMFEHMRNHRLLLERIARWLKAGGKLFVHIFVHRDFTYLFESRDESDWMSEHFFTGGMMPADHYLHRFQEDLTLERHWRVDGTHYARTAEAWLANMDARRAAIWPVLCSTYGDNQASLWWTRWRVFFMACAELWGYRGGREWFVSHYLFSKPKALA